MAIHETTEQTFINFLSLFPVKPEFAEYQYFMWTAGYQTSTNRRRYA